MPIAKAKMGSAALVLWCGVSMYVCMDSVHSMCGGCASIVTINAVKVGGTYLESR